MARLIKSNYVNVEKKCVIGNNSIKKENKNSAISLNNIKKQEKVQENKTGPDEKTIDATIERLEQLKVVFKKEADEIKQDAYKMAGDIIQNSTKKAEEIVKEAENKIDTIFKEQSRIGFEKGYSESIEKYNGIINEAYNILDEARAYRENVYENLEKEIIELVIQSVNKIIKTNLEESDEVVLNIIKKSIESLNSKTDVVLKVSKEDFKEAELLKSAILASIPDIKNLTVKLMNEFQSGDIEIESSEGDINPSIGNQISKLKDEFYKLS